MYICQSQSPNSSHHHPLTAHFTPLVSIRLFATSVSLFLPCILVHLYHFSRFQIYALIYDIFSLSDLLHSVWQSLGPSTSLQMTQFRSFLWLNNILTHLTGEGTFHGSCHTRCYRKNKHIKGQIQGSNPLKTGGKSSKGYGLWPTKKSPNWKPFSKI